MGKKRRGGGHYCWVCGKHKSNEGFSGKGHKKHICKKCATLTPEQREAKEKRSMEAEIRRLREGEEPYDNKNYRIKDQDVDEMLAEDIPDYYSFIVDNDFDMYYLEGEAAGSTRKDFDDDELPF